MPWSVTHTDLFTHVSIPFIHNPRYLNLLPPHPGKLLSASSCVAKVFLFPFAFFAQRSGPSKLFFFVVVVVIVSCEKTKEKRNIRVVLSLEDN